MLPIDRANDKSNGGCEAEEIFQKDYSRPLKKKKYLKKKEKLSPQHKV